MKNRIIVLCVPVVLIFLLAYYYVPIPQEQLLPQAPDFVSVTMEIIEPGKDPVKALVLSSDTDPSLGEAVKRAVTEAGYHRSFGEKRLGRKQLSLYFTKDGKVTHLTLDGKVLILWDAEDKPHYYQAYSAKTSLRELPVKVETVFKNSGI